MDFATEENRQPAGATPWTRQGEFSKAHPKRPLVCDSNSISVGTPWPAGDAQRSSLIDGQFRLKGANLPASLGWPQSLIRRTSWRILLPQGQIRHQALQAAVLVLELIQLLDLAGAISPNFFFYR